MIARAFQTCALLLGGLLPLSMANAGDDAPATTATRYTAADEAQYLARYEALMNAARQGQGLDIYDTMEPVPGARRVKPLRTATGRQRSIDAAAVTAARDYAARNQSAALLIVRDGLVQEAAYFGSTQPDSLLVSRSLAKPLTALVIGRAIALGKIRSLDQPVADFIHEWRGKPQEKMRMRHLLDMRSGFLRQSAVTDPQHILQRAYLHPRHDEVIIHDYPLVDEPGTRYEYANATSELVAPVIERATGMRYAEFVGRELLVPLGAAGGEVWVNRPGGMAHSGCCMRLPAESWLRIALLVLNDGVANGRRLLPVGYVAEMSTGTAQYPYYGLGLYVAGTYRERRSFANPEVTGPGMAGVWHSEPYLARDLVLFDGNGNQVAYIVPSERLVILRVGGAPPRSPEWDNSYLPNTIIRGIVRRRGEAAPEPQSLSAAP